MTLDQLRIFVAVAEGEHLTRAAASLRLTPSAVSTVIRTLEERHAVALFDRVGRGLVLTEVGRAFLDEARAVLARARTAELRLADLAGAVRGVLRLEASHTIANYWLPPRLVAFAERHPDLAIELVIANTARVATAVGEGAVDLGFVEGEVDGRSLVVRSVGRDHLSLVAAPALAATLPSGPVDLAARRWVLREKGSGTRSEFEAEVARRGIDPATLAVVLELPSNEAVLGAVVAGGGVAAVSSSAAAAGIAAGTLVALDETFLERPFRVLRHGERSLTRAAAAFVAFLDRFAVAGGGITA